MNLKTVKIGDEFTMGSYSGNREYRVTDVGQRTLIAIRVDITTVGTDINSYEILNKGEAEAAGWFIGPPYSVEEIVFDENDLSDIKWVKQ